MLEREFLSIVGGICHLGGRKMSDESFERLYCEIGADLSGLERGLSDGRKDIRTFANDTESEFRKMTPVIDNLFTDAAGKWRNALGQFTVNPVQQAFNTLGVVSQAVLDKTAHDAVNAFNIIRLSGVAAPQDIEKAYVAMQGKIAEASGAIANEVQKPSAAFQGLSASAVATGMVISSMATTVISKLADIASSAVESGVEFLKLKEQATTAFTGLLGSGAAAQGFLKELADFAAKTPFEFPELIQSAQRLTAMGFAAKDVIPTLTSVGDAVAAFGGNTESVNRVTLALTQMKSKGKVSAEEMLQLAEAGIPAWQILSEKIGKSIPESMKMAEKGAISADVAVKALVEGMESKFAGSMEKQSHTFAGLMSTISDTSQQALGSVLEPLFSSSTQAMQVFVDLLPDMQAGIAGMSDQTKLAAVAFTGLAVAAGLAATAVAVTIGGPAALAVAGLGIEVAAMSAAVLSNFGQIGSAIAAWTGDTQINFSTVLKWIGMGADGFAIFARSILQGVDVIGTALVVMGQGFKGVMGILQGFATSVKGVLTFDPTSIITGVAQMEGAWTKFDVGVSTQIHALTQRIKTNMQDTVDNMNGKYANGFQSAGVKVSAAFTTAANSVQEYVGKVQSLVKPSNDHHEGLMGAKGAKKGKDDTEKILKEHLDSVNDWLKQTKQALSLNEVVWKMLPKDVSQVLLDTSAAFHKSINDTKMWGASLQAAFLKAAKDAGDIGKSLVVGVKGTKIEITGASLAVKDAKTFDINPNLLSGLRFLKDFGVKGAAQELDAISTKAKQMGATINLVVPKIDQDFAILNGVMAGTAIVSKAATEQMGAGVEAWSDRTKKALDGVKGKFTWSDLFAGLMEAPAKPIDPDKFGLGKEMAKALADMRSDIKSALGDGIGSIVVDFADKLKANLQDVKAWAGDVEMIVDNIPGSFGRAAQQIYSSLDSFIKFANGILGILSKLNNSIPSSVSKIAESLSSMFKGSGASASSGNAFSSVINKGIELWNSQWPGAKAATDKGTKAIADSATKNAGKFNSAFGTMGAALAGFSANMAVTAATGSKLTGGIVGGLTGAFSGFLAGGMKGSALGPHGAILGAAIGGSISLLGSLFGKKSSAQKQQEEEAKKQASLNLEKTAQDISNAALEGLKKGLEVMEGIADFANIPDKQFRQFMMAYEATITRVIGFAGTIKAETLTAAKSFGETVQPLSESLNSMVQFFTSLPSVAIPVKERVGEFIAAMVGTVTTLSTELEAAGVIGVKGASKWATRTKEIVGMLSDSAGAFNAISASMSVPVEKMKSFVDSVRETVALIVEAADWHDLYGVKAAAKYAERSGAMMELLTSAAGAFDSISKSGGASAGNIRSFISGLKDVVIEYVAMAATLPDLSASSSVTGALKNIVDLFAPAVTGMNALPNYSKTAREQMGMFVQDLMAIANLMSEAVKSAPMDMLNAAADFSEKMKPVVELFAPAVTGLSALKGTSKLGISEAQGFIANLVTIANLISAATQSLSTEMLAKASDFSTKMKPVIDLIIPSLDGFKRLKEEGAAALGSMDGFKSNVSLITQSMIDLNSGFDSESVAGAARFSDIAKRIFEFVSTAVGAFQGVSGLNWSVLQSFSTVQTAIGLALNNFISLAGSYGSDALTTVGDFLSTTLGITSAIQSIGGFFKGYEPMGEALAVISNDFDGVSAWMTSTESLASTWASQASNIEGFIASMVASLKRGWGALGGLAGGLDGAASGLMLAGAGGGSFASDLSYIPKATSGGGSGSGVAGRESSSAPLVVEVHVHGSLIHQKQVEDAVVDAIVKARTRGRQV